MVDEYKGKVRVVYKHFVVHPDTVMDAHLASCAAGKQKKFLQFKKAFWKDGFGEYAKTRDPSKLGKKTIDAIAKKLGLDKGKLESDMKGACSEQIKKDMMVLNTFGVSGTPSFFINGKFSMFSGPAAFRQLIDAELAEAAKSGVPADQYYQKVVMDKGLKKFRSKAEAQADPNANKGG